MIYSRGVDIQSNLKSVKEDTTFTYDGRTLTLRIPITDRVPPILNFPPKYELPMIVNKCI